eukprot:3987453-Alexandrium_andersonii.AAC.1
MPCLRDEVAQARGRNARRRAEAKYAVKDGFARERTQRLAHPEAAPARCRLRFLGERLPADPRTREEEPQRATTLPRPAAQGL